MYLCIAVTCTFFLNANVVPDPYANLREIKPFRLSYVGVVSTFPLIIFAYMYQVNIPMIYVELERRESK